MELKCFLNFEVIHKIDKLSAELVGLLEFLCSDVLKTDEQIEDNSNFVSMCLKCILDAQIRLMKYQNCLSLIENFKKFTEKSSFFTKCLNQAYNCYVECLFSKSFSKLPLKDLIDECIDGDVKLTFDCYMMLVIVMIEEYKGIKSGSSELSIKISEILNKVFLQFLICNHLKYDIISG